MADKAPQNSRKTTKSTNTAKTTKNSTSTNPTRTTRKTSTRKTASRKTGTAKPRRRTDTAKARLDRLEARVAELEARLKGTEQSTSELEKIKGRLETSLDAFSKDVASASEMASGLRKQIQESVEHLRVQLALGRAETLEAYTEQRQKILAAVRDLEDRLDEDLSGVNKTIQTDLARRAERVKAELEALEIEFVGRAGAMQEDWAARRKWVEDQVKAMRTGVEGWMKQAGANAALAEKDLEAAFANMAKAVRHAFSGNGDKGKDPKK